MYARFSKAMTYFYFLWTDEIVEHLEEHGISPDEFEAVVSNPERRGVSNST